MAQLQSKENHLFTSKTSLTLSFPHKLTTGVILLLFCFTQAQHESFFICHPFQVLTSSFIKIVEVERHLDCAFACNKMAQCKSFNFAAVQDFGFYTCQLLALDLSERKLEASGDFHHYQLFHTDPCKSGPCQNGGKCAVTGSRDVVCTCTFGYSGKFCQTVYWVKFNTIPSCFGATGEHFSTFNIAKTGSLITMKLVRLSGKLTCDTSNPKGWNYWGCLDHRGNQLYMSTIITDQSNNLKIPSKNNFLIIGNKVYSAPGLNPLSQQLIFPNVSTPLPVVSGEQYRIWFGQDLDNVRDTDNDGTVCVDVYGLYV